MLLITRLGGLLAQRVPKCTLQATQTLSACRDEFMRSSIFCKSSHSDTLKKTPDYELLMFKTPHCHSSNMQQIYLIKLETLGFDNNAISRFQLLWSIVQPYIYTLHANYVLYNVNAFFNNEHSRQYNFWKLDHTSNKKVSITSTSFSLWANMHYDMQITSVQKAN